MNIGGDVMVVPLSSKTYEEEAIEVLHGASELLTKHGWCQGKGLDVRTGAMCATNAIFTAAGYMVGSGWNFHDYAKPRRNVVAARAIQALAMATTGTAGFNDDSNTVLVQNWNDRQGRTVEDVQLAYKQAVQILEPH